MKEVFKIKTKKLFTVIFLFGLISLILAGCLSQDFSLTVITEGQGSVHRNPASGSYEKGTKVQLTANPAQGWEFKSWGGHGFDGVTSEKIEVSVDDNLTLKAIFSMEARTYQSSQSIPQGNNGALLETGNFKIGREITDIYQLRKEVPVTVKNSDSRFELGKAYVMRGGLDSQGTYIAIPITNISSKDLSFIEIINLIYKTGQTDIQRNSLFVTGSLGKTSSSCLSAGEKGYILDVFETDRYAEIASIEIQEFDPVEGIEKPEMSFIPDSFTYTKGHTANFDKLTVDFTNQGTTVGYLTETSTYILLDDQGQPLKWSFFSETVDSQVEPGESAILTEDLLTYDGGANQLRVFITFSENMELNSQKYKENMSVKELLRLRNNHIEKLRQQYSN